MKNELFKSLAIALLTLGVAVGCASTPEDTGPTADELAAQQAAEEAAARNADLLAQAQAMADEISGYSNLTADQQARLEAGKQAIANQDGQGAYDTLSALLAELQAASMTYEVVAGDNLWDISGKSSVYGNPYQWPLIYKNNSGKIQDADLIYPGQMLDINMNPTQADVDSAVEHARTRGAWSVGSAEASDSAYLNQ